MTLYSELMISLGIQGGLLCFFTIRYFMIFSGGKLEDYSAVNESLYSCWNARGQYDAMEFVLRLRPDIHRILARSRSGYFRLGEIDQDLCLSFSTLLHETIHWWQFVGSTYGFIYSLAYPAQLFSNSNRYLLFLKEVGKYKSIKNITKRL